MFIMEKKLTNGNINHSQGFHDDDDSLETTWRETSGEGTAISPLSAKVLLTCNGSTKKVFQDASELLTILLHEVNTRIENNDFEPKQAD